MPMEKKDGPPAEGITRARTLRSGWRFPWYSRDAVVSLPPYGVSCMRAVHYTFVLVEAHTSRLLHLRFQGNNPLGSRRTQYPTILFVAGHKAADLDAHTKQQ